MRSGRSDRSAAKPAQRKAVAKKKKTAVKKTR
jgi:hypothetical protein